MSTEWTHTRTEEGNQVRHAVIEVPVDTFRSFMQFIAKHDLWDEVKGALKKAGMDTIPIEHRPVQVISQLVASKTSQQSDDPDHTQALVTPECGCDSGCNPSCQPQMPHGPTGPGDAGTGDASVVTQ
jgi:hypothetical protein